jgi:hypothetical protein
MEASLRINFFEHGLRLSTGHAYTNSEFRAMSLLGFPACSDSAFSPHEAGNEIIALAEQIKAERAIMMLESNYD